MWTLKRLMESANSVSVEKNGKWVPARPLPYYGWYGVWMRFRDAWEVVRGRAEAFRWPCGQ